MRDIIIIIRRGDKIIEDRKQVKIMMWVDKKKTALLLNDQRIGNFNQIKAVSYYLKDKIDFITCDLSFVKMISLPNIINLLLKSGVKLPKIPEKKIDFIFAAGRRSALAAVLLKKQYPQAQIIQLMRPNLPAKYFDTIITPKYDDYPHADFEVIFNPNIINENITKNIPQDKKILNVIIGGDTKFNKVSAQIISQLSQNLITLKKQTNCQIAVTTSRRTSAENINIFKALLPEDIFLYIWRDNDSDNPYIKMLNQATHILVSQDSISMIGDALATEKPVYVIKSGFGDKKHRKFTDLLEKEKLILKAEELFYRGFTNYQYKATNSAAEIAAYLQEKYSLASST